MIKNSIFVYWIIINNYYLPIYIEIFTISRTNHYRIRVKKGLRRNLFPVHLHELHQPIKFAPVIPKTLP